MWLTMQRLTDAGSTVGALGVRSERGQYMRGMPAIPIGVREGHDPYEKLGFEAIMSAL